jgi:alkylation response protein AidB-like acyl-CoA dehydrogenase
MGIHGNATAQIVMEDAVGTLVGQPNKGLAAMFVMMNAARLGVGMQSLGLTEVAYQNAVAYAKERIQMRALSGPKNPDKPADTIIVHPDVRKMLLTARAYAEGVRARDVDHADARQGTGQRRRDERAGRRPGQQPHHQAFLTDNARRPRVQQVFGGPQSRNGAWSSSCATPAST